MTDTNSPSVEPSDEGRQPQEGQTPRLASRVLTEEQLRDLPPPSWLIDGIIPDRGISQLTGRWGVGKTFIAISWAMSVATGANWHHHKTQAGPVLYIAAEGAHGLDPRLKAWREGHDNSTTADIHFLPGPVNLRSDSQFGALNELVDELDPGLVVVDTLARCMVGGDENSAKDMGVVVDRLGRIARQRAALIVHHPNRSGTNSRGSGALDGAIEVGIVAKSDTARYVELTCKPQHGGKEPKDAPPFDDIALILDKFGQSLTDQPTDQRVSATTAADQIWSLLVSPVGRSGMSATAIRQELGMVKSTCTNALKLLVTGERIETTGSEHRPLYRPTACDLQPDTDQQ